MDRNLELTILRLSSETKNFWSIKLRGLYHDTISLILSQRIRFKQSRKIRQEIYKKLDGDIITYDNIRNISDFLKTLGISDNILTLIFSIPNIENIDHEDINTQKELFKSYIDEIWKLKGVGIWTINSLRIMYSHLCTKEYKNCYHYNDKYINKNISELLNMRLDEDDIKYIFENYFSSHKRRITMFFWRIKKESVSKIIKIANNQSITLTADDFV